MKLFYKKRNLIEITQENAIVCDNPNCDYAIENIEKNKFTDVSVYVNKPCPKCGENLLTEKDYEIGLMIEKIINWLNRWFSWTTVFIKPSTDKVFMHTKNGTTHIYKEK